MNVSQLLFEVQKTLSDSITLLPSSPITATVVSTSGNQIVLDALAVSPGSLRNGLMVVVPDGVTDRGYEGMFFTIKNNSGNIVELDTFPKNIKIEPGTRVSLSGGDLKHSAIYALSNTLEKNPDAKAWITIMPYESTISNRNINNHDSVDMRHHHIRTYSFVIMCETPVEIDHATSFDELWSYMRNFALAEQVAVCVRSFLNSTKTGTFSIGEIELTHALIDRDVENGIKTNATFMNFDISVT